MCLCFAEKTARCECVCVSECVSVCVFVVAVCVCVCVLCGVCVCVCVFDLCKKSTAGPAAVIQAPMAIGQMSLADLGSGKPSQEKLAEFNERNKYSGIP